MTASCPPRPDERPSDRSGPFNAEFDDQPQRYDEMRASGHMTRRRTELFDAVLDQTPGLVLELGSGTGTLLRALARTHPDRTMVGVEPLEGYAAFANAAAKAERDPASSGSVHVEVGVGEQMPGCVEPGSVDLMISVDALHHVADVDQVVAEVTRVTAPGARWVAMEPNRLHPYVLAYHVLTPGERVFRPGPFLTAVRRAGWSLRARRRVFAYPSTVAAVPGWAARAERVLERVAPLSGAVVLDLVKG